MHTFYLFFFFKQKTAYEMRISDWSSDVCSSDLGHCFPGRVSDAGASLVFGTGASARALVRQRANALAAGDGHSGIAATALWPFWNHVLIADRHAAERAGPPACLSGTHLADYRSFAPLDHAHVRAGACPLHRFQHLHQ